MAPHMVALKCSARWSATVLVSSTLLLASCGAPPPPPAADAEGTPSLESHAQALVPAESTDVRIAALPLPTALAFSPDGRLFVSTKAGAVHIIENGALLPQPALVLSALCTNTDRGLLGLALDPAFDTEPFLYVYYSAKGTGSCLNNRVDSPKGRVSRFTVTGNVVDPASETVLLEGIPAPYDLQPGGALGFGPDGALYVGTGDGYCDFANAANCGVKNESARRMNALTGKVLRIAKDGSIPTDNPYAAHPAAVACGQPGATVSADSVCAEIFASGFRDPAHLAFEPKTGALYVTDSGRASWEEVDRVVAGGDYGWNVRHGSCTVALPSTCTEDPGGFVFPDYAYRSASTCDSIGGGAFVPRKTFAPERTGAFLFSNCNAVSLLVQSATGKSHTPYVTSTGAGRSRALLFGPSFVNGRQALYYTSLAQGGEVRRLLFEGEVNRGPTAALTATPTTAPSPFTVTLDGSLSTDPDEDALVYVWDFGDGSAPEETAVPTVQHRYVRGSFVATLVVRDTDGAVSAPVTVAIEGLNSPPAAVVSATPASGPYPLAVSLSGAGSSDPNDDALTYLWSFGDGSPPLETTEAQVSHTYALGGFTASLTVRDEQGATSEPRSIDIHTFNSAPVASLGASAQGGPAPLEVTLDGSASVDPNGDALTYLWDFGDGSAALETRTPTAQRSFAAGTHSVSLRVTDTHGVVSEPAVLVLEVTNTAPQASLVAEGTQGPAPLAVTLDGSQSTDANGDTLTYVWDFGDGSSVIETAEPTLTHTFAVGTFEVTLTVRDALGAQSEPVSLAVSSLNTAPVASLSSASSAGAAPLLVLFDASQSQDVNQDALSYHWDFGDGSPAVVTSSPFASHAYPVGTFTAQVTVRDVYDAASAPALLTVTSLNSAPQAVLTATPATGLAPLAVTLDASASSDGNGDALTYLWSFGDGSPDVESAEPGQTHLYAPGQYVATLVVRDVHGALSEPVTLTLSSENSAPVAQVTSPQASATFAVGETLTLTGEGVDAQDGPLSGAALQWEVWMHGDGPSYVLTTGTGDTLTFTGPAPSSVHHAATAHLEVRLTATDAHGLSHAASLALEPRRVSVQLESIPSGLTLLVGGQEATTPATLTSWEGLVLDVGAEDQVFNGSFWRLTQWSDGGTPSHSFTTPATATTLSAAFQAGGFGAGLLGQYFDDRDLSVPVLQRVDATVDFLWGTGSPAPELAPDTFSVRWTGQLEAMTTEVYTLHVTSDDGVRLWVNGLLVIDDWVLHAPATHSAQVALTAGERVDIRLEYFENQGGAVAQLEWSSASVQRQVIPQNQLYPVPLAATVTRQADSEYWEDLVEALAAAWARLRAMLGRG